MGYVWPLSGTATPDSMNTSFGPRINNGRWDFHDGIDLPAPVGTSVYAVCDGAISRAGAADAQYSSRHVRLTTKDRDGSDLHILYLHLDAIGPGIVTGAMVKQGQPLATVGDDDAQYPHLHFEFRKGGAGEKRSVHPLHYLPFAATANFSAPTAERFNRTSNDMAARLLFEGASRLEGALKSIEVDILDGRAGTTPIETRRVDFDDKETVNEGNGDSLLYVKDIGVEGYQRSPMASDGRTNLKYGILSRHLPPNCTTLLARVTDVRGATAISAPISVPDRAPTTVRVDFENGQMPPSARWTLVCTPPDAVGLTNEAGSGVGGSRAMQSVAPAGQPVPMTAAIERALPADRFEWTAEGRFNVTALNLAAGDELHLLSFLGTTGMCVAAMLTRTPAAVIPGLLAHDASGLVRRKWAGGTVALGTFVRWRLRIRRVGTRESTAVLSVEDEEWARLNWDSTADEPRRLLAGIGHVPAGASATVVTDSLRIAELD